VKPKILHLTGDFPDPYNPAKTPVIRRLIDLTSDDFDHQVVSLNRRSPSLLALPGTILGRGGTPQTLAFGYGLAAQYCAPGSGILHTVFLDRLGDWLADQIERSGRPGLVVAHKLTIEGLVAERAARKLGLPFCVAIQGKTDLRAIEARPDLRGRFAKVLHGAQGVIALAPWALQATGKYLGAVTQPCAVIPCPPGQAIARIPPSPGKSHFLAAFHLRNHRTKNLANIARAIDRLRGSRPGTKLRIAGGGGSADWHAAKIAVGTSSGVEFLDHQTQPRLAQLMNDSVALVMPSQRESFGLAFVEALWAGLPIIYPAGSGVDGYFDGCSFALRVDPHNPAVIAAAMEHAIENEAALKRDLADWQASAEARRFERTTIAAAYSAFLMQVLES